MLCPRSTATPSSVCCATSKGRPTRRRGPGRRRRRTRSLTYEGALRRPRHPRRDVRRACNNGVRSAYTYSVLYTLVKKKQKNKINRRRSTEQEEEGTATIRNTQQRGNSRGVHACA